MERLNLRIADKISQYRDEVNKGLYDIYSDGLPSLMHPINYVLRGEGKRLRPLLTIIASEACGGSKDDVISTALAVEVLHNFTLVHDDIMDQDYIRHGQETVHRKWDDGIAILSGDAMLSLALELLNQSPNALPIQIKIFIKGLLTVCEGQALDKEFEVQDMVPLKDYIRMIDLKTGHMIGLAAELGAVSSGAEPLVCQAIRDYGRLLGRAFQIQDDYLEIFSHSENMGKSLESDIILGKKTFLIIQALKKNRSMMNSALSLAQKDFGKGLLNIRQYLTDEGIKDRTIREINGIIKEADKKIANLSIDKNKLLYFSELIKKRGY